MPWAWIPVMDDSDCGNDMEHLPIPKVAMKPVKSILLTEVRPEESLLPEALGIGIWYHWLSYYDQVASFRCELNEA
jgi:hypothetical protein